MIAKRIIYCWFGGEKPQKVLDCMKTWKEKLPDWELLEINESNFDIHFNKFVEEAYKNKKYAFVSDVARLWALYEYGGVYMDTDVIVNKNLDIFLGYDFFTGFEQPYYPVTAIMGSVKNNMLIREMLESYNNREFKVQDDWTKYETNTMIMSDVIGKYFDRYNDRLQEKDNMAIYPSNIFCKGDYTKHLMTGMW